VKVNKMKVNIFLSQMFPQEDQHKNEEATDINLQNIGIGK
jgi:hypothetical protein